MIPNISLHCLDTIEEMLAIEELQEKVWPGQVIDIIPSHLLMAAVHGGGILISAVDHNIEFPKPIGFVFSFPGFYHTPDGPRLKQCSHQLGVLPEYQNMGVGFKLKRAQWQLVRNQGIDRITWTFDPLLSRNAHLNITKLGTVCNTYHVNFYGDMHDSLNVGLPSDRFEVDWWVNSNRVVKRLHSNPRPYMKLDDFIKSDAIIVQALTPLPLISPSHNPFVLIEIPDNITILKQNDLKCALDWRLYTRSVFIDLFARGYLITDFIYDNDDGFSHSYYVLCHGDATL
jgi:predicted GNAT superfamily acetyltransferase